jgi:Na+/phosphate symporter
MKKNKNMEKNELVSICQFYDKYRFLPTEKKKGIKILNKYIKELKETIASTKEGFELRAKVLQKWDDENIKHCMDKIKDYEKLKKKLQKEIKKKWEKEE